MSARFSAYPHWQPKRPLLADAALANSRGHRVGAHRGRHPPGAATTQGCHHRHCGRAPWAAQPACASTPHANARRKWGRELPPRAPPPGGGGATRGLSNQRLLEQKNALATHTHTHTFSVQRCTRSPHSLQCTLQACCARSPCREYGNDGRLATGRAVAPPSSWRARSSATTAGPLRSARRLTCIPMRRSSPSESRMRWRQAQ